MQGGDNNLAVVVSAYEPNVQCYGTADVPGFLASCQSIVDKMDTSTILLILRADAVSDASIILPYSLKSGEHAYHNEPSLCY